MASLVDGLHAAPADPTNRWAGHGPTPRRLLALALLVVLAAAGFWYGSGRAGGGSAVPAGAPARTPGLVHDGLWSLPAAARVAVSGTLGARTPAYGITATRSGFRARNPAQHLALGFGRTGVLAVAGQGRIGLRLSGVGRGDSLGTLGSVAPRLRGGRVVFDRGALSEWYSNGPLGLEQGFTLARAPAGPVRSPLTLALALTGNLAARLSSGRLTLSGKGVALSYGGLAVHDARGRALRSWLELSHRRLLIRVADRGARYPLRIDPVLTQEELTAADGEGFDELGYSVAVSGNTMVVGAPSHKVGSNPGQGAAYVFTSEGTGEWEETAELTASDGAAGNLFGSSVAISGSTIAVGAPERVQGGVYVFNEVAGEWKQTGEIYDPTRPSNDQFGFSVALSATTLAVGALVNEGTSSLVGTVYVFSNSSGHFKQTAELEASDPKPYNELGYSVAISGNTIVAGAPAETSETNHSSGAVYVFSDGSGPWEQTAKLTASDEAEGDYFGLSVAVSGTTIVIGAPYRKAGEGTVYVFNGAAQVAELTPSDGAAGDLFGRSVVDSGGEIVVGAPDHLKVGSTAGPGAAYEFTNSSGPWEQAAEIAAPAGATGDEAGESVAASGSTVALGAPGRKVGANVHQGAVEVASGARLSIAEATVAEPASGTATANFTVSLAGLAEGPVTVEYATQDGVGPGGATSPGVYEATTGTLTFKPGETVKTIPVTVKAAGFTGRRTFTVTLSNATEAEIATATATGTIIGPSPLQVTITLPTPAPDIEETEAGAVTQTIPATVKVKNVSKEAVESVTLPSSLTLGWDGQAPIAALPIKQTSAPETLEIGTLAAGASSAPAEYQIAVEGDGQFSVQALVGGSQAGELIHALGTATFEPTSQLLVIKNTLGAVVHSPTNPGLIAAGTHFLIKMQLENRSYEHRLQIDPYEPEMSGNAHGGSLIREGEPTTYEAPTGSLDEVKPSPAIVLAPREKRNYFVVVGTSGSNAFAKTAAGGGTRATVSFEEPDLATVNDEDEPTAVPDDRTVLTPGSKELQVGIDDSATPPPPYDPWKAEYFVAKGVVLGLWNLTWGALKGVVDLGKLGISAFKGILSLEKSTVDELYYLGELWDATRKDPAARQALIDAIQTKVETAFSEAPWLLEEKGAALYATIDNAVGTYFTNIFNEWYAGNWEQALTDMSEGVTVASLTVGPIVARVATGVLARLAPVANAWKVEVAADVTKTTEELEAVSKTIEPAEDAIKGLDAAADGYGFSIAQMRKFIGMGPKEIEWLSNFTRTNKLSVVLRSRAEESIAWLKKGAYLKPSLIKSKNVSWLDAEFLGYSARDIGRVVLKKLPPLREVRADLLRKGIAEGSPEYENVVERWVERKSTYAHELEEMQKWNKAKEAKGKWPWQDSGIDPTLQLDEPKNYKFRLHPDEHDPGALVPEFYDEITKRWGSITGDIDLVSVTKADGSALSPEEYVKVLKELAKSPLGIQHPDSTVWIYHDEFWFKKKAAYLESSGNVEFGADGDPRKVTFNLAASDPTKWTPYSYRIVWNRGYSVGPGQVP